LKELRKQSYDKAEQEDENERMRKKMTKQNTRKRKYTGE
jgi:hypothetical protein